MLSPLRLSVRLSVSLSDGCIIDKKAVLPQGNRAMPQVFFSVFVNNIHYKYKNKKAVL